MPTRQYFTVQEADAAVREIRPLIEQIHAIRDRITEGRPELWEAMERAAGNGGSPELTRLAADFEILDGLVHRILDMGAEIKDLSAGLLDFRALRNDEEVFLCWQMGEDRVLHWHGIEAGFAGRQPIESF